jgi:polar amino acid transport system substrate-binding protein
MLSSQSSQACELSVGWDEWQPYIYKLKGELVGLEFDTLTKVADAAGCKLHWRHIPWARAVVELKNNRLDMLYSATRTVDREQWALFSEPYRIEEILLVTKASNSPQNGKNHYSISIADWIKSIDKTTKIIVGAIIGNNYGDKFNEVFARYSNTVEFYRVPDDSQLINMLSIGRIDAYLIERGIFKFHQSAFGSTGFKGLPITEIPSEPMHYMFSKKVSPDIIRSFDLAINAMALNSTRVE